MQLYYIPETLDHAGITHQETQLLANMGIGFVKVCSGGLGAAHADRFLRVALAHLSPSSNPPPPKSPTLSQLIFVLVAMRFTDKYGRRTLLVISGSGMALSLFLVAISFEAGDILPITLTGICLFMGTFSLGFGPLTWVVASEVFPLHVRGAAMGLSTFVNRITSGIITSTFLSMSNALTPGGSFFLFGTVSVLSVIFVWLLLPETHGRTLEEIEHEAGGRSIMQRLGLRKGPVAPARA